VACPLHSSDQEPSFSLSDGFNAFIRRLLKQFADAVTVYDKRNCARGTSPCPLTSLTGKNFYSGQQYNARAFLISATPAKVRLSC
jgi:hypothetical protein